MALDWTNETDEPKPKPEVISEAGIWDKGIITQLFDTGLGTAQNHLPLDTGLSTIQSHFQQYYGNWEPVQRAIPEIRFKDGSIERTMALKPDDLLPKNRYKLHQKIDELIKKAYK